MMKGRRSRVRGQILVMVALGAVGLLALVALAVDGSRVYMARRHAQNAADAAALAMAWSWLRSHGSCTAAVNQGMATASSLGYDNNGTTNTVEAYCPPQDGLFAGKAGHFQVRIQVRPATTFLQILGWKELATTVEAVARASNAPLFGHNAIVALNESGGKGIQGGIGLEGKAQVRIDDGGMFSNSSASDSFWATSNTTIDLDTGFGLEVVGGCQVPAVYQSLCRSASQVDRNAWLNMLDDMVPPMPRKPSCTHTLNKLQVNGGLLGVPHQTRVYCVKGPVSLQDVNIRGKVVLIAQQGISLKGTVTAKDLEMYVDGDDVVFGAGVEFDAERLRIYATGNMQVDMQGGAIVHADNALLYLEDGTLNWAGNSEVKMCAPPRNDPQGFGGLVLFLKNYSGNKEVIFRGTSDNWMAGTLLAPRARVKFNGDTANTHATVHCHGMSTDAGYPSQIIANSVRFVGNTNSFIDFDPRFLYQAAVIELLK